MNEATNTAGFGTEPSQPVWSGPAGNIAPTALDPATLPPPTVQVAPKSGGSSFGESIKAVLDVLNKIRKSETVEAFAVAGKVKHFWVVSWVLSALISGIAVANFFWTMAYAFFQVADELDLEEVAWALLELGFGTWLTIVVMVGVMNFTILTLHALTVKWTLGHRRVERPFAAVANLVAVSALPSTAVVAVMALLLLLPASDGGLLLLLVLYLILLLTFFMGELLLYIGMNRTANVAKSMLVGHTLMTALWGALSIIAVVILYSIFESMF